MPKTSQPGDILSVINIYLTGELYILSMNMHYNLNAIMYIKNDYELNQKTNT